jgi:dihydroorotate dehydrogenase (fumarate)
MASPDLSTTYLGLHLANPFLAGASPLGDRLDTARRLEDSGCAAIVLHSLFEEQISQSQTGRIRQMDPLDPQFANVLSYYPDLGSYTFGPVEYLEHLRALKSAVNIPIIASLNGTTPQAWLSFAISMEQAGADAIELNPYEVVTDPDQSGTSIEHWQRTLVKDLKRELKVPLAVKLSPFFTAFANVAKELEHAGADGLVLFNRFLQPDIDLHRVTVQAKLDFSTHAELPLRLRWLAILHGRVKCSLAASGGVETPGDGIKAVLAGANVVQLVSTILRHGPSYFASMRDEMARWMTAHEFADIAALRGRLSLARTEDPEAFERAQYIRALSGWESLLPGRRS